MGKEKYISFLLGHQMPLGYRQVLAELCNRVHIVMSEQIVKLVGGKGVFLPTGIQNTLNITTVCHRFTLNIE